MTWLPPEAHPEIKIQAQVTSLEGERNAGRKKGSGTEKGVSAGVTGASPGDKTLEQCKTHTSETSHLWAEGAGVHTPTAICC